ncbi:coiled-coil domain-containing protein 103-like isoform X1 [Amphibalanus amphitrite]|uniref:coiled-coil domain-containing protein 103-like isoform X1 n=1 Tax=Amphibalanus amphitrite TaxID=1232801 RepID=UPI001C919B7B|nr:coiled-coil domain-containing protein 103-like isoform X1 [Amphibalanus amphitrite]XP_043231299.1 coiled-coil domain-containing protein 103-like isoform X1 [Amphibalanus amphitrite]XP_043231300.1 coiled-coil domain-containing protein 103-like isoform X1 [Amphibalanus amphitrite]
MARPAERDDINFVELERELRSAVEQDQRRALQNDAKLRAVQQKVGSYDEFRDLVKAATLRPLDRKDTLSGAAPAGRAVWNSLATRRETPAAPAAGRMNQCPPSVTPSARLPATVQEFGREWRRLEVSGRLTLLRRMGAAALGHVLRAEIPAGLLGEVLYTLLAFSPNTAEVRLVVELLQAMSEANRFHISLQFLSVQERRTCEQLMEKLLGSLEGRQQDLADAGITEWTIKELRAKYKV